MAISGQITVTTEELQNQARAVNTELNTVRRLFDRLKQKMDSTSGFWTGQAGDAHRKHYNGKLGSIEEMLNRYQELVSDLQSIAGVYEETEKQVLNASDSLPVSNLD